jgi:hypothetical protein
MSASLLTDLLAVAQAALDREDAPAAAAAVDAAARTCADMAARGVPLDRAALGQLLPRHSLLLERAVRARDGLATRIAQAGRSRRAIVAYGRRRPG